MVWKIYKDNILLLKCRRARLLSNYCAQKAINRTDEREVKVPCRLLFFTEERFITVLTDKFDKLYKISKYDDLSKCFQVVLQVLGGVQRLAIKKSEAFSLSNTLLVKFWSLVTFC